MNTKIIRVDNQNPEKSVIEKAASLLKEGELVAFPTETVYGLGANVFLPKAVKKIFEVKKRAPHNPLGVLIGGLEYLEDMWISIPLEAEKLAEKFWPGPLTIIFFKNEKVSPLVTGGLSKIGLRFPNHPVTLAILEETRFPLACPSANISGRPSPTRAQHVFDDLKGRIPLILDGGETNLGIESTVIDLTSSPPKILRKGAVSLREIQKIIPEVEEEKKQEDIPHYQPEYPIVLAIDEPTLYRELEKAKRKGKRTICVGPHASAPEGIRINFDDYPKKIFHLLRELEKEGIDLLIIEVPPGKGSMDEAVRERLIKAAQKTNPNCL